MGGGRKKEATNTEHSSYFTHVATRLQNFEGKQLFSNIMELSHLASSVIRHATNVEEGDIGNSQPPKVKKPIRALVFSCCILMLVTILVLTDMLCSFFTNLASNEEFLTKLSSLLQACNNQSLHLWFFFSWGALFPRTADPIFHESLCLHPYHLWYAQNRGEACAPLPNM